MTRGHNASPTEAARGLLIIFDVDGTLVDSWDWMAGALIGNADRFGYRRVTRAELEQLRGLETRAVLTALDVAPEQTGNLVTELRRSAEAAAPGLAVFPGMAELLADLDRQGDVLALVSSNSGAAVRAALGPAVDDLFQFRRCDTGVFDKAAAFAAIVANSGCPATATVAVGDETRDVDAAEEAGIGCIAVEWGYADAALLRLRASGRTAADIGKLAVMLAALRTPAAYPAVPRA